MPLNYNEQKSCDLLPCPAKLRNTFTRLPLFITLQGKITDHVHTSATIYYPARQNYGTRSHVCHYLLPCPAKSWNTVTSLPLFIALPSKITEHVHTSASIYYCARQNN